MESLQERMQIKYDKLNDLLPINENLCIMETRKNENFKMNFANTERLKKSSIISMQKLLNTDFNENKKRKWG